MAETQVRVLGMEQLRANLTAIEDRLRRTMVRDGARSAAELISRAVRGTTYGGGRERRSGALLANQGIATRLGINKVLAALYMREGSRGFVGGRPRLREAAPDPTFGPNRYWWFLERGTRRISPRPWVGPALGSTSNQAIDAFAAKVSEGLDDYCHTLLQR